MYTLLLTYCLPDFISLFNKKFTLKVPNAIFYLTTKYCMSTENKRICLRHKTYNFIFLQKFEYDIQFAYGFVPAYASNIYEGD